MRDRGPKFAPGQHGRTGSRRGGNRSGRESDYLRQLRGFDPVIVSNRAVVAAVQRISGVPCSSLPLAVDAGRYAPPAPGDPARLVAAGRDADRGGRVRDLVQHRVPDRVATRGLLERGGVERGDAGEVVLAPGEVGTRTPHLGPHVPARHAALARGFGPADEAQPIYLRVPDAERALSR